MLRATRCSAFRSAKKRAFLLRDPHIAVSKSTQGYQETKRSGVWKERGRPQNLLGNEYASMSSANAFPLLSHTDFGYQDHIAQTQWVQLMNYMPKRNKGTPPWWRGADTYSPLYAEQGRFEYQRYMMIARFPGQYKIHFLRFLKSIRAAGSRPFLPPQLALHWLLRMIVDNFNPQHVHYQTAMQVLISHKELDMARDVWKIMERQQTWPDDKCIAVYLRLCAEMKDSALAFECWNRYCNEKQFLRPGETDPKPVSRIPFTLNRDEMVYLPKWKKHFDHDPNLDVTDLNRFNTTRDIYQWMSIAMLASRQSRLFRTFYTKLEKALATTPTPVPEPPSHLLQATPQWGPFVNKSATTDAWMPTNLGPATVVIAEMPASRYDLNSQFLLRTIAEIVERLATGKIAQLRRRLPKSSSATPTKGGAVASSKATKRGGGSKASPPPAQQSSKQPAGKNMNLAFARALLSRAVRRLGKEEFAGLQTHHLFSRLLRLYRVTRKESVTGAEVHRVMHKLVEAKQRMGGPEAVKETCHAAMYLEVLKAFATESKRGAAAAVAQKAGAASFDPHATVVRVNDVVQEMLSIKSLVWSADLHLAVMRVLVYCGTQHANTYFVTNVLRAFKWDAKFLEVLYKEYRRNPDVDQWAELTKRMLVWTQRYGVDASERLKRMIEDDYDIIKVQTRTMRDLVEFVYRDQAEKKQAANPLSQLPNPVLDYVSHALPFPDRDTGHPNEYGDLGQWRAPESGVKGPLLYAPKMDGEEQRGYHSQWRDNSAQNNAVKLPAPWDRKYMELNKGKHPSYDMAYAGPMPEIFPTRVNWRKPTRWDFHEIESQSKYRMSGPF